jgi:DNA-binding transcriptional MerR regulator
MRNAGLPVEAMIEYVQLYQQGDSTLAARLNLLQDQLNVLLEQQKKTQETIERLEYKISRYKKGLKTGKLTWQEPDCCNIHKKEK